MFDTVLKEGNYIWFFVNKVKLYKHAFLLFQLMHTIIKS